jgi:hypothetical protein
MASSVFPDTAADGGMRCVIQGEGSSVGRHCAQQPYRGGVGPLPVLRNVQANQLLFL